MNKKMKGFVDPITLGFIIAIVGGSTAITVTNSKQSEENGSVAISVVQPAAVTIAASKEELARPGKE